ncbi:hypothetical protein BJ123_108148 [Rhodopseudomonas thermotolerans]|uniref:Uncharacterized protein n=2 Tax=Rhodopseudomonas TaxID=1073 RepID=A0A336JMQ9_9BRAD|nr:hypothetical protein BJ125_108147 [Rhodopseudomonas pentothenatexigens]REG03585.1 hypothetical protein BJ123_108148 [Rhodopseudomonas thermotolerans]SSW90772.1 hypothetical protein SAMN05892882_108147 [Rhodopseudomonas pentothenatexigens]
MGRPRAAAGGRKTNPAVRLPAWRGCPTLPVRARMGAELDRRSLAMASSNAGTSSSRAAASCRDCSGVRSRNSGRNALSRGDRTSGSRFCDRLALRASAAAASAAAFSALAAARAARRSPAAFAFAAALASRSALAFALRSAWTRAARSAAALASRRSRNARGRLAGFSTSRLRFAVARFSALAPFASAAARSRSLALARRLASAFAAFARHRLAAGDLSVGANHVAGAPGRRCCSHRRVIPWREWIRQREATVSNRAPQSAQYDVQPSSGLSESLRSVNTRRVTV